MITEPLAIAILIIGAVAMLVAIIIMLFTIVRVLKGKELYIALACMVVGIATMIYLGTDKNTALTLSLAITFFYTHVKYGDLSSKK